jgi:hypothetical protein
MNSNLDTLVKDLGIFDLETGEIPISDGERHAIKIQLSAAQLIAEDVLKIREVSRNLSDDEIIDGLLHNWIENIRDFASAAIKLRRTEFSLSAGGQENRECCQPL